MSRRMQPASIFERVWFSFSQARRRRGEPRYVVYGVRHCQQDLAAGVHGEFPTEDAAYNWLMKLVLKYGTTRLDVVVVKLMFGEDVNGERSIIRRIGNGKGWWE